MHPLLIQDSNERMTEASRKARGRKLKKSREHSIGRDEREPVIPALTTLFLPSKKKEEGCINSESESDANVFRMQSKINNNDINKMRFLLKDQKEQFLNPWMKDISLIHLSPLAKMCKVLKHHPETFSLKTNWLHLMKQRFRNPLDIIKKTLLKLQRNQKTLS